jgi:hypothetical protein
VYIIGTSGSVSHIAAVSVNVESLKTNTRLWTNPLRQGDRASRAQKKEKIPA